MIKTISIIAVLIAISGLAIALSGGKTVNETAMSGCHAAANTEAAACCDNCPCDTCACTCEACECATVCACKDCKCDQCACADKTCACCESNCKKPAPRAGCGQKAGCKK